MTRKRRLADMRRGQGLNTGTRRDSAMARSVVGVLGRRLPVASRRLVGLRTRHPGGSLKEDFCRICKGDLNQKDKCYIYDLEML